MSLVFDSSVTLAWLHEDEQAAGVEQIFEWVIESCAVVPSLWLLEVANSLTQSIRRGRIAPEHRTAFLSDLAKLAITADGLEQIRLVRDLLAKAPAPTQPEAIANVFDGRNTAKRRERIGEVLETLVATGLARSGEHEGQRKYFLPR